MAARVLVAGGVAVALTAVTLPMLLRKGRTVELTPEQIAILHGNDVLFIDSELTVLRMLLEEGQAHLFSAWPPAGTDDQRKRSFVSQLLALDAAYTGGLGAYVRNARTLLQQSRAGANPFEGYTPSVPEGVNISFSAAGLPEVDKYEALGLEAVRDTAFVLVAGGLGERLGYSGIKVALPVESATGICMLAHYIHSILALQRKSGAPQPLQLAIMTSSDTHDKTLALLKTHAYFGSSAAHVHLIKQEKVACLSDGSARLALEPSDPFALQTKPHGHGDVHLLLHNSGLARRWLRSGVKWVAFFQDTNALVFRGLLPTLGVSQELQLDCNSLCVPRKAKEAIGAITTLTHANGRKMTVNVEYNQLDPLLRATTDPDGDVNDPQTGMSKFPGNINQIVLKLASYVPQLEATGGVIAEFVNPKYVDASRTTFTKATRLECMMQDYPKSLPATARVGFTTIREVWAAYSPVKNSLQEALAKQRDNSPTHSATSGELDMYNANSRLLALAGVAMQEEVLTSFNGLNLPLGPRVVLSPDFMSRFADLRAKVINPSTSKITNRSTLVILGENIQINNLDLDGTLILRVQPGSSLVIENVVVRNEGWSWVKLEPGNSQPEEVQMRGFQVHKVHGCMIDVASGNSTVANRQLTADAVITLEGQREAQTAWTESSLAP